MARATLMLLITATALAGCQRAEEAGEPVAAGESGQTAAPAAETPEPAGDDPQAQLVARLAGDWRMDLESLERDPQIAKLPPQQRMQALVMARQMMSDVSFSFTEDGKVRLGFGPTGRTGTYTVDKVDGNALHITTRTKQGDDESVEKVVLRIEGDAMWVTEGADGRTIRLLRGKPAPPTSQPTAAGSQPANGLPPGHPPANGPASQPTAPASQRAAPASQPKMPAPKPADPAAQ